MKIFVKLTYTNKKKHHHGMDTWKSSDETVHMPHTHLKTQKSITVNKT